MSGRVPGKYLNVNFVVGHINSLQTWNVQKVLDCILTEMEWVNNHHTSISKSWGSDIGDDGARGLGVRGR